MAESENGRIIWIDVVRAIAVSCVILNHAVDEIFITSLYGNQQLTVPMTGFMYTFFTIGRIGVPLFLFITGMLLLTRTYSDDNIRRFYKNNFWSLLRTSFVWIILNNVFDIFFYGKKISLKNLIFEILLLKQNSMPHFWYIPVILGLYLAIPFISVVLHNVSKQYIIAIGSISFLYQFIMPTLVAIINVLGISKTCSGLLDVGFLGSCYGIYMITGFYIRDKKMTAKESVFCAFAVLFGIGACVLFQVIGFQNELQYNVWYNFAFLYIAALAGVRILSQIKIHNSVVVRTVTYISRLSFAIYFIHMPVRFVLIKYLPFRSLPTVIALPVFFFSVYVVSIAVVSLLAQIRILKKYLLWIKE